MALTASCISPNPEYEALHRDLNELEVKVNARRRSVDELEKMSSELTKERNQILELSALVEQKLEDLSLMATKRITGRGKLLSCIIDDISKKLEDDKLTHEQREELNKDYLKFMSLYKETMDYLIQFIDSKNELIDSQNSKK
ncbi:hypothetical protein JW851_00155 [Candidatus Woesearchaeota archaeon]|nr:hypothetical protein [Candidatus Woesearchaeota archaeon]